MRRYQKIYLVIIGGLFLLFNASFEVMAEVQIGADRQEVIAALGEPQGSLASGEEEMLCYPAQIVVIKDKKVCRIEANALPEVNPVNSGSSQEKKPEFKSSAAELKVKTISQGGAAIDLSSILVPGKITIVDFYAEWCGPCRYMGPKLEELAQGDPEVFLRKVDILKWGTPVTAQYNINSVPNVRVFNRSGKMVGEPTSGLEIIKANIRQAK